MSLVISYTCELDPTTSARVWRCSSLVHSLVSLGGNDVFRQIDGWEYTFNDSNLYSLTTKSFKRDAPIRSTQNLEGSSSQVHARIQKGAPQSLPSGTNDRGLNRRQLEYSYRQSAKSQVGPGCQPLLFHLQYIGFILCVVLSIDSDDQIFLELGFNSQSEPTNPLKRLIQLLYCQKVGLSPWALGSR